LQETHKLNLQQGSHICISQRMFHLPNHLMGCNKIWYEASRYILLGNAILVDIGAP